MSSIRTSCAVESLAEPLAGTAATDHTHLLLEHPGPWGRKAWEESDLPADVREGVAGRAAAAGVRLHLVRRHGRTARPERPLAFAAHTRPGRQWLRATRLDDVRQLLDLDLAALAAGDAPRWDPVDDALVLVCTNGRRDACCATRGRPVAQALTTAHPDLAWESNHLGGHRFAAAALVLPSGAAYGRLDPESALEVVERARKDEVLPSHLRGRGCHPQPVQAAEVVLLQHLGETRPDNLQLQSSSEVDGTHRVTFRHGGVEHTLVVERRPGPVARTSCSDAEPKQAASWVARLLEA